MLARCFPIIYFPRPVGVLLASLCCAYERLPQGAPTSPAVSNLVMKLFDEHMLAWCGERDITYSRYCDDMTFSGDFDFQEVKGKAEGFLEAMGMELNRKKTRVSFRGGRQAVTGLVVNERPGVPREYKRRLRQEIYQYRKFGLPETETDSEKYRARLLGKIRYVLSVQPEDAWFAQAEQELKRRNPS